MARKPSSAPLENFDSKLSLKCPQRFGAHRDSSRGIKNAAMTNCRAQQCPALADEMTPGAVGFGLVPTPAGAAVTAPALAVAGNSALITSGTSLSMHLCAQSQRGVSTAASTANGARVGATAMLWQRCTVAAHHLLGGPQALPMGPTPPRPSGSGQGGCAMRRNSSGTKSCRIRRR